MEDDGNLSWEEEVHEENDASKGKGDDSGDDDKVEGPSIMGLQEDRTRHLVGKRQYHGRIVQYDDSVAEAGKDH